MLKTPDNPEAQERTVAEQTFASWYRDYPNWIFSGARSFVMPETSDRQLEWIEYLHASLAQSRGRLLSCRY